MRTGVVGGSFEGNKVNVRSLFIVVALLVDTDSNQGKIRTWHSHLTQRPDIDEVPTPRQRERQGISQLLTSKDGAVAQDQPLPELTLYD